jgi:hypothetical protein
MKSTPFTHPLCAPTSPNKPRATQPNRRLYCPNRSSGDHLAPKYKNPTLTLRNQSSDTTAADMRCNIACTQAPGTARLREMVPRGVRCLSASGARRGGLMDYWGWEVLRGVDGW